MKNITNLDLFKKEVVMYKVTFRVMPEYCGKAAYLAKFANGISALRCVATETEKLEVIFRFETQEQIHDFLNVVSVELEKEAQFELRSVYDEEGNLELLFLFKRMEEHV